MSLKFIILISMSLSLSYAEIVPPDDFFNQIDGNIHEGSSCEDKVLAALSVLQMEINRKFDAMENNIPSHLEETINRKVYTLENRIPDKLEEYFDHKFYKLEKKMLEKLEEYMDEKLRSLKKDTPGSIGEKLEQKLDTVEKIITNKLDVLEKNITNSLGNNADIVNRKVEVLEKQISKLDENFNYRLNTLTNKTFEISDDINYKLDTINKKITNLNNNTIHCKHDLLDEKIHKLEVSINSQWDSFKKMMPEIEENIKRELHVLDEKVPEKLEKNISRQLDTINKNLLDTKVKGVCKENVSEQIRVFEHSLEQKLGAIEKKIPNLEENLHRTLDVLQNLENKTLAEINKYENHYLFCKKHVAKGYGYKLSLIDNETLNHVSLEKTSTGDITYLEMHIAIKAAKDGLILLSPVPEPGPNDSVYEIGVGIGNGQQTDLRQNMMKNGIGYTTTPNILSSTDYRAFYIKISNGKLEFGKEGSPPIISYSKTDIKNVKYFGFCSWAGQKATFLYDCPAPVKFN